MLFNHNLIQPEVYLMHGFIHMPSWFFFPIIAIWLQEPSAVETIPLQ